MVPISFYSFDKTEMFYAVNIEKLILKQSSISF